MPKRQGLFVQFQKGNRKNPCVYFLSMEDTAILGDMQMRMSSFEIEKLQIQMSSTRN